MKVIHVIRHRETNIMSEIHANYIRPSFDTYVEFRNKIVISSHKTFKKFFSPPVLIWIQKIV